MQRTSRTRVRRHPERGVYDAETIHTILDAGFLCHVGFVRDEQPYVIPTLYARVGEKLYLHGSPLSPMLRQVEGGIPLCITVTHVDGLVLARSAMKHSVNYRSVMVLGRGQVVTDRAEKEAALEALVEQVVPGRAAEVRGGERQRIEGDAGDGGSAGGGVGEGADRPAPGYARGLRAGHLGGGAAAAAGAVGACR